jgi:hypothetical protein
MTQKNKIDTMEKSKFYLTTRVITIKGTRKAFQDIVVRSFVLINKLKILNPKTNTISDLSTLKKHFFKFYFLS